MKAAILCASLFASALLATSADAQDRRVYAGEEANALKCAAYFAYTSRVGEQLGVVGSRQAEVASALGMVILTNHVSGTPEQKLAAMKVIVGRMPNNTRDLFEETRRYLDTCARKFLPQQVRR